MESVCACAERVEHDDAVMRPTSEAETPTLQGSQESPIEWDHELFFKPQNWSRNWVSDLQCPWKRHWLWLPYHMATKASIEIHALPKKHQVQREICLDWNRMILDHCKVQYTINCKLSHKISQVHTNPPKRIQHVWQVQARWIQLKSIAKSVGQACQSQPEWHQEKGLHPNRCVLLRYKPLLRNDQGPEAESQSQSGIVTHALPQIYIMHILYK